MLAFFLLASIQAPLADTSLNRWLACAYDAAEEYARASTEPAADIASAALGKCSSFETGVASDIARTRFAGDPDAPSLARDVVQTFRQRNLRESLIAAVIEERARKK